MTATVIFPDVMADLKVWLVSHPLLSPLIGGRVFFRIPDTAPTAPFLRLYRAGGGPDHLEDTPVDNPRISHEVWGNKMSDYPAVRAVAIALRSAYYYGQGLTLLNPTGSTMLLGASVVSEIDAPDGDLGIPRIVVDALLAVRLATS